MKLLLAVFPVCAFAAITNIHVEVSNTQALLRYTAPDASSACGLEVSEDPTYTPVVYDVDTAKFSGSDQDNRTGNISQGTLRMFVIGHRTADVAADGKRYSRALQAATTYHYRLTCIGGTATGSFRTRSIPFGASYNDTLPPGTAGDYAWPTWGWTDRAETHIDPLTGAKLRRISLPGDRAETFSNVSVGTPPATTGWTNPGNIVTDDGNSAVFSGAGSNALFIPANLGFSNYHDRDQTSFNYHTVRLKAGGAGASDADRTIQLCLTLDRANCATDWKDDILTGSVTDHTVGTTVPILAYWTGTPTIDLTDVNLRSGTVDTSGTAVTYVGGSHLFNLKWTNGSKITINSVEYTISAVNNERSITITATAGTQSGVAYAASNYGVLLRKKSASTDNITVQWVASNVAAGAPSYGDSAADTEEKTSCSPVKVAGPASEMGYHCAVGGMMFWIGATTGTVTRFAPTNIAARGGDDGWNQVLPFVPQWDPTDGNIFYAQASNGAGNVVILKSVYTGSNADLGAGSLYDNLTECGSAPCFTITNLTPETTNETLSDKLAAFTSDCSGSNPSLTSWGMWGVQDNKLLIQVKSSSNNNVLGCQIVFSLATNQVVAVKPSWKYWPLRWGVMHGTQVTAYDDLMFYGEINGGSTSLLGQGYWRSKITSGAVNDTGDACPARPGDSPISEADWPTGNNCKQVTVAGEPCDPDPNASETTNPAKCEVAADGYLQDAIVRDLFCVRADGGACSGLYAANEYWRLIKRTGLTWDFERHYGSAGFNIAVGANSYLIANPATCSLNTPYACSSMVGYWNYITDTLSGEAVSVDRTANGTGHNSVRPGGLIWSVSTENCPTIDSQQSTCYAARAGTAPANFGDAGYFVANNPAFAGKVGIGSPNVVDGHPGQFNWRAETGTALDSRPMLGEAGISATSGAPATTVTGTLYKFTAAQLSTHRPRILPTLTSCGAKTTVDISSATTGDVIAGTSGDTYKHCIALKANECRTGSSVGDVYINCPQVFRKYSANALWDDTDIMVADNGAHTQGNTQTSFAHPDMTGRASRIITYAMSRYRWTNLFWNFKSLPLNEWGIVTSPLFQGMRSEAFLVKMPPIEVDSQTRNTFIPVVVSAGTAPAGANRLLVKFGYNPSYQCTTRLEACYAITTALSESAPFVWAIELANGDGDQSGSGYSVTIPAISGRVLYYQVVWRASADGSVIETGPAKATLVQ